MTPEKIKQITDKVKTWCLVGFTYFDKNVQQYTCEFRNGENCECHRIYQKALDEYANTVYNVMSARPQGVYGKDEFIAILTQKDYDELYGDLDYKTITNYGGNRVYIEQFLPDKSEPHPLNPHPERDHDGW